ncbi:hypothetical protein D1BOALGB6SA_5264 [Olavius sp. associated proteobacterium Delta 1]|nr:hypothetical protein D1BOALGB6SA_5264 [Olavius sp. associated proteobacterium Delta 1]
MIWNRAINGWFQTENPWTLIQSGDVIYIYVYDLNEDFQITNFTAFSGKILNDVL